VVLIAEVSDIINTLAQDGRLAVRAVNPKPAPDDTDAGSILI